MTTPTSQIPKGGLTFAQLKKSIQLRHLDQLRTVPVENTPPEGGVKIPPVPKSTILSWISTQMANGTLPSAIAQRGIGGNDIDFKVVILTLIESSAMYLRKDDKVQDAIVAAKNNNEDLALQRLDEAQQDIVDIANAMGLDFTVICDLVDYHPSGHSFWNGSFSGVFFPKDKNTTLPFLGLAFKGTNTVGDALLDAAFQFIKPSGDVLFANQGVEVETGFYTGIFGTYDVTADADTIPFTLIASGLDQSAKYFTTDPVVMHITGHSLGGAYATLTYTEILRLYNTTSSPPAFSSKDLYTLGGPRVAPSKLPELVNANLQSDQHSWRVVADADPVATVPPPFKWQQGKYPYVQFDKGVKIYQDASPAAMPSELPNNPVAPGNLKDLTEHFPQFYYTCLLKALAQT